MSDKLLYESIVRLAYEQPYLRPKLVPLLKESLKVDDVADIDKRLGKIAARIEKDLISKSSQPVSKFTKNFGDTGQMWGKFWPNNTLMRDSKLGLDPDQIPMFRSDWLGKLGGSSRSVEIGPIVKSSDEDYKIERSAEIVYSSRRNERLGLFVVDRVYEKPGNTWKLVRGSASAIVNNVDS